MLRALQKTSLKTSLRRPADGDAIALAEFERALAEIYIEALKTAPKITPSRPE